MVCRILPCFRWHNMECRLGMINTMFIILYIAKKIKENF